MKTGETWRHKKTKQEFEITKIERLTWTNKIHYINLKTEYENWSLSDYFVKTYEKLYS